MTSKRALFSAQSNQESFPPEINRQRWVFAFISQLPTAGTLHRLPFVRTTVRYSIYKVLCTVQCGLFRHHCCLFQHGYLLTRTSFQHNPAQQTS